MRLRNELPRVSTACPARFVASSSAQQALFAFVDSLVKTLLTCVAEPPRDAYDQAVARGKAPVRPLPEKRRRRDGWRFSGCHDGVIETWRRKLTKQTTSGFDQTAHTPAGKARRAPGPRLCGPYSAMRDITPVEGSHEQRLRRRVAQAVQPALRRPHDVLGEQDCRPMESPRTLHCARERGRRGSGSDRARRRKPEAAMAGRSGQRAGAVAERGRPEDVETDCVPGVRRAARP